MTNSGIIIIVIFVAFFFLFISYFSSRDRYNGKQISITKHSQISFKHNYKVIFKDKNSLLIEEISPNKIRFLMDPSLVTKSARPGTEIRLAANSKEMKEVDLYHIAAKGPMVKAS